MEKYIKQFKWTWRRQFIKSTLLDEGLETTTKLKQSVISISIALVIGMLLLAVMGFNPFKVFGEMFKTVFETKEFSKQALFKMSTLGLSALAAIVAFKSGVINIGISGQMMFGGLITMALAINLGDSVPNGLGQVLAIIIGMSLGALFAVFAGLLKIFFNISEVVSTIMLNWVAFFLIKYIFSNENPGLMAMGGYASKPVPHNFSLTSTPGGVIVCFVLLTITVLGVWFLMNKTTFGYSLKLTGINKAAAEYSGINTNRNVLISMAISGAIAGLLGLVLYMSYSPTFSRPTADSIPTQGFDGMAIAIVAFNNPLAIVPLIGLFGIMQTGIVGASIIAPGLTPAYINFLLGIIMYSAAISSIYLRFKPFMLFSRLLKGTKSHNKYLQYKKEKLELDKIYFEKYEMQKENGNQFETIKHHNNALRELKNKYKKHFLSFSIKGKLKGGKK